MRNFDTTPRGLTQTCPRCHGSGRIAREDDGPHELVALIPVSDHRLKPRRTKLIISASVVGTALLMGIFVFFFYPRSVQMSSLSVKTINATIPDVPGPTKLFIAEKIRIKNENFVSIALENLKLTASYLDATVGYHVYGDLDIKARSSTTVDLYVNASHFPESLYPRVHSSCKYFPQQLILNFVVNGTAKYLSQTQNLVIEKDQWVNCRSSEMWK
eukprot:Nk52_evm12s293 gene=Nk52_evmTU12s293